MRLRMRTALALLIVTVALTASLSACGKDETPPPAPTVGLNSSTTQVNVVSPEQQAVELAREKLQEYFTLQDASLQDPKVEDKQRYELVAVGTQLFDLQRNLAVALANEYHQTGATKTVSKDLLSVDLTQDTQIHPPVYPLVRFKVCQDDTEVKIVNKAGADKTPEGRVDRYLVEYAVINYHNQDPTQWRVAYSKDMEGAC